MWRNQTPHGVMVSNRTAAAKSPSRYGRAGGRAGVRRDEPTETPRCKRAGGAWSGDTGGSEKESEESELLGSALFMRSN